MFNPLKVVRLLIILAFAESSLSMIPQASAQEEIAPGSALRKELFELARPKIECAAKQPVRFQGSMKQMLGWAFLYGTIVDADGALIPVGPGESAETAILWVNNNDEWSVVEAVTGFTDVIYLDWADKHQAPPPLFKL